MEAFPPSYEHATVRDVWAIIAPYIPSADLYTACLVSKEWYEVFCPFLWGVPTSHFEVDDDDDAAVYVALNHFRRVLKRCRQQVRELTHTLRFPPPPSDIYGAPTGMWLVEILEYLPNLQSLIVSGLPFFDHRSLTALGSVGSNQYCQKQTYKLRLLLASHEQNTTTVGLRNALQQLPKLVYLDISYTTAARDPEVLSSLSPLRELQVLKLRGIGLRNNDVDVLAEAIGTKIRFLDIRDNLISDNGLRGLIRNCFLRPDSQSDFFEQANYQFEWCLPTMRFGHILTPDSWTSEYLDAHFFGQLTLRLDGRSVLEDIPHVGITHLYISGNHLSSQGVFNLLSIGSLVVFDGGTVDGPDKSPIFSDKGPLNGAEKLISILRQPATRKLTYLRIHHAIVLRNVLVQHSTGLPALPQEQPINSLSAETFSYRKQRPCFEAASTSVYGLGSTLVADPFRPNPSEVQQTDSPIQAVPGIALTTSVNPENITPLEISDHLLGHHQTPIVQSPLSPQLRDRLVQELIAKRPLIPGISECRSEEYFTPFHPSSLPNLQSLVLTDLPSCAPATSPLLSSLKSFISACADEACLASLQAESNYSLPPGLSRAKAEKQLAKSLFALESIVLEVAPARKPQNPSLWPLSIHNISMHSKSSTGDRDSENLWAAAANDFSFFVGERCGTPIVAEAVGEKESPAAHGDNSKQPVTQKPETLNSSISHHEAVPRQHSGTNLPQSRDYVSQASMGPEVDLVMALASFRRERKAVYNSLLNREKQAELRTETIPSHVEGHWKGDIKIVRI
ncbi:hypothetical protein LOY94_004741 [Ophidiomyces ophidiicola]|uniref:Uncharacterized protein n=1 Tax=Ophidiomyces ophidiicola TaxID=1387563 RepID=A0ACB8V019_9EURO|nr:hypothetical protein LOZ60_002713 [Ophidiomyces ophidiicola]KAI2006956.1 hypothetical protein LOZ50_002810 [Ophidiomyces ophidiicola]KAI2139019.1 hypothetical protein LOZ28_003357 [Ophidiomyces ophidiicola]KAI2269563.1 hypothetical protein LOZ10_000728 [Ophidiomyces ophidiicola]KAI2347408.1 hypothetical protein LOY94_004741 [Ophidiomyces ophidiicola]